MRLSRVVVCCVSLSLSLACAGPGEENVEDVLAGGGDGKADGASDPGALVALSMSSRVGVLLDEIPGADRERVAAAVLARPASFWQARARMHLETTTYRLTYRNFYYNNKGQLPLPPREKWTVTTGTPERATIDGHDLVMAPYTFTSTLVTGATEPGKAEPKLAKFGGIWDEVFVLPTDPEHLLERTGYACMDEEDFPPNSVDSENARSFYDDMCMGGEGGCHVTLPAPKEHCKAALKAKIGRVDATMRFERLPWDAAKAAAARVGTSQPNTAIEVLQEGVEDNRIIYRYIPQDSCAIAEGCVGGSGWRRLLQFTATVRNNGAKPAHIGDVSATAEVIRQNMFEFSACHGHMHFSHYGSFQFSGGNAANLGGKKAFCMESTSRYLNNETTPLTHPYGCHFQGIAAGWGDDYIAGIECQWVDVTSLDTSAGPVDGTLSFLANPDGFVCEGALQTDAAGNPLFESTDFRTETGAVVHKFQCDADDGWDADNVGSAAVTIPVDGGYVTKACTRGQLGSTRNCGFIEQDDRVTCTAGQPVSLRCTIPSGAKPQVVRACDYSVALGTGLACAHNDALANTVVTDAGANVTVKCPGARDLVEQGGAYSVFTAPLFPDDAAAPVSCVVR